MILRLIFDKVFTGVIVTQIKEFSKLTSDEQKRLSEDISKCDWDAGRYLGYLLTENRLSEVSGAFSEALLLTDGNELASFCTFVEIDEIDCADMKPWIGFVYTFPQYRGRRCAGQLIEYAVKKAKEMSFERVFVSSEEKGLYEKYGFTFVKTMHSIHGYDTGVFVRDITEG